jgi:hypothetical protein
LAVAVIDLFEGVYCLVQVEVTRPVGGVNKRGSLVADLVVLYSGDEEPGFVGGLPETRLCCPRSSGGFLLGLLVRVFPLAIGAGENRLVCQVGQVQENVLKGQQGGPLKLGLAGLMLPVTGPSVLQHLGDLSEPPAT